MRSCVFFIVMVVVVFVDIVVVVVRTRRIVSNIRIYENITT